MGWLTRLFKGKERRAETPLLWEDAPGAIPLSELGVGKTGVVLAIETDRKARAERLSAMGLTPDSRVTVKQRFPSMVIAVGETEIALDRAITQDIKVKPVAPDAD